MRHASRLPRRPVTAVVAGHVVDGDAQRLVRWDGSSGTMSPTCRPTISARSARPRRSARAVSTGTRVSARFELAAATRRGLRRGGRGTATGSRGSRAPVACVENGTQIVALPCFSPMRISNDTTSTMSEGAAICANCGLNSCCTISASTRTSVSYAYSSSRNVRSTTERMRFDSISVERSLRARRSHRFRRAGGRSRRT